MTTNYLAKAIQTDFNFLANTAPIIVAPIFDEAYQIASVEQAADALITLEEDACFEAGDEVFIYGAGTCPKVIGQAGAVTSPTANTFRMGFDASEHGSEGIGVIGKSDLVIPPVFAASLHEPIYGISNLSSTTSARRIDSKTIQFDGLATPINKVRIAEVEHDVLGVGGAANCGCEGKTISVAGPISNDVSGVSAWLETPTLDLGLKVADFAISTLDNYIYEFQFPLMPAGTWILDITRYAAGGLVEDWHIRGVVTYGT